MLNLQLQVWLSHSFKDECHDLPRLPAYKDGNDWASYHGSFKRNAELIQDDQQTYDVRLGALLSSKAAKIYASLSSKIITNYQLLKKTQLRTFCKTPDRVTLDQVRISQERPTNNLV